MNAEIHEFRGITKLDSAPGRIIDRARDANLTEVVILGFRPDGSEFFDSSKADGGAVLWHLQRAIHRLMTLPDDTADRA